MVNQSVRFYYGDESISIDEWNCALLVIRHLMCQMVKTAEEADAACEFITNLANNLKPKLVREEANYLVLERPIWRCFMKLGTAVRGNGRDLHFSKDPNVSGFSWSEYSIELGKIY
ncbi:hypothetical protein V1477_001374 [Vespula maculifrons]|uniref:Uncharacterized protein n=1 Tax=Vespula maculifrons TaxID=7453 RepID=A0ABD2D0E9_VESMC